MPDINAIATRKKREIEVLVWNYHDDDVPFPAAPIDLVIAGLPSGCKTRAARTFPGRRRPQQLFHRRGKRWVHRSHLPRASTNACESAGQLQLLNSPTWIEIQQGSVQLHFMLPRQSLSLVRVAW